MEAETLSSSTNLIHIARLNVRSRESCNLHVNPIIISNVHQLFATLAETEIWIIFCTENKWSSIAYFSNKIPTVAPSLRQLYPFHVNT